MEIPVKRFDKNYPLPAHDEGAACFDLICREDVTIPPHQLKAVPQNIALQVPTGYALLLFSRSSTPLRKGLILANGVGVVDSFYNGDKDENLAFFLNVTDSPVEVRAGEKIVQGMIVKTEPITWAELEALEHEGVGGYNYINDKDEEVRF
jgi:dUTP pyrophosphatase